MTKRAVLGGTTQFSTKALYVSQNSDNVDSITKPMEFHPGMASGMHVFHYTQGTINAPALGSDPTSVTITHNWGNSGSHGTDDRPLFAMRWSYPHEIVNGEATACYPPVIYEGEDVEEDEDTCEEEEDGNESCEEYSIFITEGAAVSHLNKNQIKIENYMYGQTNDNDESQSGEKVLYYALLVFYEHDWTGGKGL